MNFSQTDVAYCSECECAMDVSMLAPFTNVECPECGEHNRVKTDVGSYVLMKRQGLGGMSLVFGAVDKNLGREVAIKLLNEEYSMDEKRIAQFELEARITAAMSHPHIVKVFTVGQAYNRFYIAMELISGDSLEKKMSDEGKLSESEVLKWAQEIADGLNAANESGLIHRDIKPGNILFDKDGHVKIVDFGLALVTQGGKAQADEIWATPYYVSPEALDILEEDFRSDIYALGASLFHALSGKPPFTTESRSTTELKEIKRNLPSLKTAAPWLSDETCAVIDKAMAFEMDDRFSSYKELIDALQYAETVVNYEGEHPPISSTARVRRRTKVSNDSSWKIPAIAGASVLLIGGVLFAVLKDRNNTQVDDVPVKISQPDTGANSNRITKRVGQEITLARGSLKNRNYKEATRRYQEIAADSKVSKDTVYWAGLQSATVHWLDGNSRSARKQLRQLAILSKKEGSSGSETGNRLESAVDRLTGYQSIDTEKFNHIDNELDAMIAFVSGLKNWSLGYVKDALVLFDKVEKFQVEDPSVEFVFYRDRIADYKHDAALLHSFRSSFHPKSMEELNPRVAKLQGLKSKLKTKGRVLFDLEEWQVQCEIHKKRLIREATEAISQNNASNNQENNKPKPSDQLTWDEFMVQVKPDLTLCNFDKVVKLLEIRDFQKPKEKKRAELLNYLCRNASGFKATVRISLSERKTNATITLKQGELKVTGISSVNHQGFEVLAGGDKILVQWGDIEPSSLVDLHKFNVTSNLSDFEKNLRLEQAICFAWLTGEIAKAQYGAQSLSEKNSQFKARWKACMALLGEE